MADAANFERWDPGVLRSTQVEGVGVGLGAGFDVQVRSPGGSTTLRYRTTRFDPPDFMQLEAVSRLLTSVDRIEIATDLEGSLITYDADLQLNGVLRIWGPALGVVFNRIGNRAAAGLARAVEAELVHR